MGVCGWGRGRQFGIGRRDSGRRAAHLEIIQNRIGLRPLSCGVMLLRYSHSAPYTTSACGLVGRYTYSAVAQTSRNMRDVCAVGLYTKI